MISPHPDDQAVRLRVASALRDAGIPVRTDGSARKLGRQLETAAKVGARWAVIVQGPADAPLVLRDLASGEQRDLALTAIAAAILDSSADPGSSAFGYHRLPCRSVSPTEPIPAASSARSTSGERVTLAGWVHRRRDHGHLTFFDLRDRYGITQVVTNADDAPVAHGAGSDARNEWVIQVEGTVRQRPEGTTNADLATGEVELAVEALTVLNASKVPPFYVNEEQPGLDETIRLTYRYVDLRRPPMQERIMLRARLASAVRRAFEDDGVRRDRDAEPDPQHA